jgi:hypothetical protein
MVKSLYLSLAMSEGPSLEPVIWVGSSREEYVAQRGGKHRDSKALSGSGGAGVLEVIRDFRGDTFRAV